jgi:hypothetical protein
MLKEPYSLPLPFWNEYGAEAESKYQNHQVVFHSVIDTTEPNGAAKSLAVGQ